MINTFYNVLENKSYFRSRGYGYLVPEIGIGFLSFYLGSFVVNLFCFFLSFTQKIRLFDLLCFKHTLIQSKEIDFHLRILLTLQKVTLISKQAKIFRPSVISFYFLTILFIDLSS
jgi:hypothetical protein